MDPVQISEITHISDYELERPSLRPRIMELKDRRRVRIGDHLTLLFENRETVRYQIQEMMRIERIVDPLAIRHEVDTYNELIPLPGELSASLLIEYPSPEQRAIRLHELLGLEDHVWLKVANLPSAKARFDTRQISTDRLSSVQYIKFPLTPEDRAHWHERVRIVVDHPKYKAVTELTEVQRAELASDFA